MKFKYSSEVPLGQDFEISINSPVSIKDTELKIELVSIRDSRCPTGVTCIWQGQASVTFNIFREDILLGKFIRSDRPGDTHLGLNGYSIDIIAVDPYPEKEGSISSSKYNVKMMVSKE